MSTAWSTPRAIPSGNHPGSLNACLPALLEALGWRGNQAILAEYFPPNSQSLELGEVLQRLQRLGFSARRVAGKRKNPQEPGVPALLQSAEGGFTCLIKREGRDYLAYDGQGRNYRLISPEELASLSRTGQHLVFSETGDAAETRASPFWLQDLLSRNRGPIGIALGFSCILALFGLMTPQFISLLYREISTMSNPANLVALGCGALLFAAGEITFISIRMLLLNHLKHELSAVLGRETLRRIVHFPLSMTLNTSPSAQYGRMREFENLASQIGLPITVALLDLPFITILLVALGFFGGVMVLVPLVTVVVFLVLAVFAYPLLKKTEQEAAAESASSQTILGAILKHGPFIQCQGTEEHWGAKLGQADLRAIPSQQAKSRLSASFNFLSHGLVSLAGLAAVLIGVGMVMDGQLGTDILLASMMLVWRILDPCRSLFVLLGTIHSTLQTGKRLAKFMALGGERQLDPRMVPLRLVNTGLRIEGFYFKYPGASRFALANVSLAIADREALHISGHPGCGFTSLCWSILGLTEGAGGRILIGDQNIQQFVPGSLRKCLGWLPTQVPVLPLSVLDNLRLAKPDCSDAEIEQALAAIGLLEDCRALPLGLETTLDQAFQPPRNDFRRCLGIARLFLADAPLLMLDLPEQGLAPASRRLFLDYLGRQRGEKTLLILSNDPDFAALSPRHATMERGRLNSEEPA